MLRTLLTALLCVCLLPSARAAAQTVPAPDTVPYVPTRAPVVAAMLALGRVQAGDVVYDLGSGDGRILVAAARRHGARGVGFEIDARLVRQSRERAAAAGVHSLVRFVEHDLFDADLRDATVVMLYLSDAVNRALRPKLLRELPAGARVVSNTFHMGEWAPDRVVHVGEGFATTTLHMWRVPADVDGFWQLVVDTPRGERRYALELLQRFQQLQGAARSRDGGWTIEEARLAGERISWVARPATGEPDVELRFTGRLVGSALRGTYMSSADARPRAWRATRFSDPREQG